MKYITGFGAFWYDFIVGDSVVLAIGGAAVLASGAVLVHWDMHTAAELALPAIVIGTLGVSLRN